MIFPLDKDKFTLDSASVAGFFGGREAVSAMRSVHMYHGRKWMGWYNTPGSYTIAQRYGQLANNRFWDGLFPGPETDPAVFFGLDDQKGPEFIAAHSGTQRRITGHLSSIFMKAVQWEKTFEQENGRQSRPVFVTIVKLPSSAQISEVHNKDLESQSTSRKYSFLSKGLARLLKMRPGESPPDQPETQSLLIPVKQELLHTQPFIIACLPIVFSIGACIVCGVFTDWYCFGMILMGILSNGISCFVLGSGELLWQKPNASKGSPPGDGILMGDEETALLLGDENQVQFLTTGKFVLKYDGGPEFRAIGMCSIILYIQFLAQLLLIPQGTLVGQIIFLATLVASWARNCHLSSIDKEKLQIGMLKKELASPKLKRFRVGTRTTMAVFVLLILAAHMRETCPDLKTNEINLRLRELLDRLLPNKTPIWERWKQEVLEKISHSKPLQFDLEKNETELLQDLYQDATTAYELYTSPVSQLQP